MFRFKRTASALLAAAVILGSTAGTLGASALSVSADEKKPVSISKLTFKKITNRKIRIYWSGTKDDRVKTYIVQRADIGGSSWKTVGRINSDGDRTNGKNYFTDILNTVGHQRYTYRVKVKVADSTKYYAATGGSVTASNLRVCIDPGHYNKENAGTYGYTEGEAVLTTGLLLRDSLKSAGIDVFMTRDDKDITVGGKKNADDGDQLFARGTIAGEKKCDLFVSLHSNANSYNANGRDTTDQPKYINKTMVFVNKTAYKEQSKSTRRVANYIGKYITTVNRAHGVYSCPWYNSSKPAVYTDDSEFGEYNDGLKLKGRLIYRKWGSDDYYAVLRGAAYVGVPGMLIEHGYHTYPGYCKKFMSDSGIAAEYASVETAAMLKYLF